jgi:PAS domain S-box-containing protein
MFGSNSLLWRKPPVILSYGVAVLSVAAGLIVSRWPALHLVSAPTSLFLCAVMVSAWFGGVGPGMLATVLSWLAFDYYFAEPMYSFAVKSDEIPRLVIFGVSSVVAGSLSAAQRSANESLRRARDDLKGTVQEVQRTNEALQAESRVRQRAEEGLRQSEAYLAEAQRLSHTGSWAWAPATGEIGYFSEECFTVLGFDPHEELPRLETFFQRIYPDDRAGTVEQFEKARRENTEFELDYRIVHPGGDVRDIHTVGHPVSRPSGDLVEYVGTVMDVTERKRAEEEREKLRQAQTDLARVNRITTMGELTASLAHEVNQPIAAAVTSANSCLHWLAGDVPNLDKARAAVTRIVRDGTRAAEIVSRIRLLFQKGTAQWQLANVNEIIEEMIVLLHGEAERYSISIQTELAADLPQVVGDRVQLQQVMMNLMTNSIDAMKAVDGTRELAIKSQRAENEQLLVSVADTGVGLPPQQADEIFNAFFTTKPNGTGMGLRICRSIVESHGGRLWAGDNSSRGARFFFTLPTNLRADE